MADSQADDQLAPYPDLTVRKPFRILAGVVGPLFLAGAVLFAFLSIWKLAASNAAIGALFTWVAFSGRSLVSLEDPFGLGRRIAAQRNAEARENEPRA